MILDARFAYIIANSTIKCILNSMSEAKDYIVIDTREAFEFNESHADGAVNISPMEFMSGTLPKQLQSVAKDTKLILYCRTGQRSNTCSMILKQFGFTNIINGVSEGRVSQMIQNNIL